MKPKNKIYPLLRMLAVALTAALLGPVSYTHLMLPTN